MARGQDVTIRLDTQGVRASGAALEALGDRGQRSLQRLERAAKPTSRALKAVDHAGRELRGGFEGLSARAGGLGGVLGGLGPAGLAAGAGIGALTAALWASVDAAKALAQISRDAAQAGLGVEEYQALTGAATIAGVEVSNVAGAIETLQERVGLARLGIPEGVSVFEDLGIAFKDSAGQALPFVQVLDNVADAYAKAGTEADRIAILQELAGDEFARLGPLLRDGAAGLETYRQQARDLGLVLEADLIAQASELDRRFNVASQRLDNDFKRVLIALAPAITALVEGLAGLSEAAVQFATNVGLLSDDSLRGLKDQAAEAREEVARLQQQFDKGLKEGRFGEEARPAFEASLARARERVAAADAAVTKREAEIEANNRAGIVPISVPAAGSATAAGGGSSRGAVGTGGRFDLSQPAPPLPRQTPTGRFDAFVADQQRGPEGPLASIEREREQRLAALDEMFKGAIDREQEYLAERQRINDEAEAQRAAAVTQSTALALSATSTSFDEMASLARTYAGEQSGIYKALFAASKAFAAAEAAVKIPQAIANATTLPFPLNIAEAARVVSLGATVISSIASVSGTGFRQGGYTGPGHPGAVRGPVHAGEYVLNQRATQAIGVSALDELNRNPHGVGRGGGMNITINNHSGLAVEATQTADGDLDLRIARAVQRQAPGVIAADIANPNGRVSRALGRSTTAARAR